MPDQTKKPDEKTKAPAEPTKTKGKNTETPKSRSEQEVFSDLIAAIRSEDYTDDTTKELVREYLQPALNEHKTITDKYNILVFYEEHTLVRSDADKLYRSITSVDKKKPTLLIVHSMGGRIEPAYLMSKLCREYTDDHFHVAVPRQAKSAATLLSCGADKIHMGSMSELGPIDPQIGGMPALALKNALQDIASMANDTDASAEMFATYLAKVLKLEQLGYYERVAESAAQYAERLINARKIPIQRKPSDVANDLVYKYKDHGFVIDSNEARIVFDNDTIATGSAEYKFSDALYEKLNLLAFIYSHIKDRHMSFIGTLSNGLNTINNYN